MKLFTRLHGNTRSHLITSIHAFESANPFSLIVQHIEVIADAEPSFIRFQYGNERVALQCGQGIVSAPPLIDSIEIRTGYTFFFPVHNSSFVCHKIKDIAVLRNSFTVISARAFGDRKLIVIMQQSPQSVKHPAEDCVLLCFQFLSKKRIVLTSFRFRLGCQDQQALGKSVRLVIERSR